MDVQIKFQVMLQIHAHICSGSHTPESRPQLQIVHPDLDIFPIEEQIQATGMIQMQMPNNDLLNILNLIPRRLNGSIQLVLRLIPHPRKHIRDLRAPDLGVVFAAARLPEDEALVRVLDEDAVHGHLAALVDEGLVLGALERGVAAAQHEALVGLEPADLEHPHLRALGADIADEVGHGALVELSLDAGCHSSR